MFSLVLFGAAGVAKTITVDDDGPADFNNIQAAIDASVDGDMILIAPGTYTGDGNRDINFRGKMLALRSESGPDRCIIDCNGTMAEPHRGFIFCSGEGADSVLDGLTITGGYGPVNLERRPKDAVGGAILCLGSSPTVNNCTIRENFASNGGGICSGEGSSPAILNSRIMHNTGYGGAIYCYLSNPTIANCVINNNITLLYCDPGNGLCLGKGAAGISSDFSSPMILNCIICNNTASGSAGALFFYRGNPLIRNCTIAANRAHGAGAILCFSDCAIVINNCIFWNNAPNGASTISLNRFFDYCPTLVVSYSDVQGGRNQIDTFLCNSSNYVDWEPGNMDADPCFADLNNGDYHLMSEAGRWDPNSRIWVQDEVTSPCIDAGDPMSPIDHEPFPSGGIINMGAYGGTAEASKSYFGGPVCEVIIAGDINGDCRVDFADFVLMARHWLEEDR
jgi:hypothetical protein